MLGVQVVALHVKSLEDLILSRRYWKLGLVHGPCSIRLLQARPILVFV